MRRRLSLPLVAAALALTAVLPARAEDNVDPFKKIDEERARQRDRQRRAGPIEPERPALPPMGGVGTRPWRDDGRRVPPEAGSGAGPEAVPGPETPGRHDASGRPETAAPAIPAVPPPVAREALPPLDERSRAVERGDLGPALTGDGSALPAGLWQGVAGSDVEKLVATLELPARSPAMAALWRRVWTAEGTGSADGEAGRFTALGVEALVKAGLVREAIERSAGVAATGPGVLPAVVTRLRIAAGDRERGCADVRTIARQPDLARPLRGEMLLLGALCAAAAGDQGAAGLAAELARGQDVSSPFALAALDAFAAGDQQPPALPARVSLNDRRFLELFPGPALRTALERAEPALAAAVADDEAAAIVERIVAAEIAARHNAFDAERLAALWRRAPAAPQGEAPAAAAGTAGDPLLRRAQLLRAVEAERTPLRKVRLARQLLDEARRAGLEHAVSIMLARTMDSLAPVAEVGWFAETAIAIGLAAGRNDLARRWIEAAERERFDRGGDLAHWMVLVDLADTQWQGRRGEALAQAEQLSVRGRLSSDLLHRLATVLDALDYQIPIPLWEAASRTPQPRTGHLPETGVLSRLGDAAKKKEHARTVLLAFETLGPATADQANIIGLGDVIRALRRAGLEADARRLALEAVLPGWPRQAGG